MGRGKVLVLGDDTRGFLATVRSLGRNGITVHAAPADFRSPAILSRYIAAIHDLPPWLEDGSAWIAAMEELLGRERFDLVIACDERGLLPLQRYRDRLSALTCLAIPDDASIAALFDKHATRELAHQAGVPVAPGRLARANEDADAVIAELDLPVVVKPRRSYTLEALGTRGRVQVLDTKADLEQALAKLEPGTTLLEGFFPGSGVGLSVLASRGRVLQPFQHHRVHEKSGSSFYRVSAAPDPELVHAASAVVGALGFTGVAMFEFKRNDHGDWILLEVNARPWGSLPLPVALGVDFPYRWYQLLVDGVETPAVPYRAGVFGRNLMPDLMASMADAEAQHLGRLRFAGFMARRVFGLSRVLTGGEVLDVMVSDDPRPGRSELKRALNRAVRTLGRALPGTLGRDRERASSLVRAAAAAGRPVRVLFVCQGNICRSPYAAALLRRQVPDPAVVDVGSFGMIPRPGRPTPPYGLAAARAQGIALDAHRSAWLTRAEADAAAVIIVFDDQNVSAIADRYPGLRTPVVKLGDLAGLQDIVDPIDGDAAMYERTYARIGSGITELARLLQGA